MFTQRRLPTADIPAALRRADPNLRYQPSIELIHPEGTKVVRIGPQSLSFTRRAPYPGWEIFGPEIAQAIDVLFSVIPDVSISRLGLRYVNALRSDNHKVTKVADLNLDIAVDKINLEENLNLNYRNNVGSDATCLVRIATRDFARGKISENTSVLIDIDVSTIESFKISNAMSANSWKEAAHEIEKEKFFRLLTPETIKTLRAD